jgi:hypothetical protein
LISFLGLLEYVKHSSKIFRELSKTIDLLVDHDKTHNDKKENKRKKNKDP